MSAAQWGGASAIFLASAVEWVEAFTIVLAVSLTIGWRRAMGAAVAALALVAVLIAATGAGIEAAQADIGVIRAVIGIFLLLFGLRWYVKAIRRYSGRTALHDEAREFAETREQLERAEGRAAWVVAFKGVLLEGLEVWLLVVALGHTLSYAAAAGSAAASLGRGDRGGPRAQGASYPRAGEHPQVPGRLRHSLLRQLLVDRRACG